MPGARQSIDIRMLSGFAGPSLGGVPPPLQWKIQMVT